MDSEIIAERNKYSKYPLVRPLNPPNAHLNAFYLHIPTIHIHPSTSAKCGLVICASFSGLYYGNELENAVLLLFSDTFGK